MEVTDKFFIGMWQLDLSSESSVVMIVRYFASHSFIYSLTYISHLFNILNQVNAVKFNDYASVVVSAGYDRSLRVWDCRSHTTQPIQIMDTFSDSVMSLCLTKTQIIAGSVDGTVRTFDIRIGRYVVVTHASFFL